ncbi:MAG: TRAP transporter small permease subunit [Firmicutes bacterium]|nr:TRAP transporter small permease subunit [Bacillota bacterium]
MKKITNVFIKINNHFLLRFQSLIMTVAMWGLIVLMMITIISRNILHFEIIQGTEELLCLFASWMYFVGGSIASYEDSHISADLIGTLCKTNLSKAIHKLIICIITIFTCVIGSLWAYDWVATTAHYHAKSAVYGYSFVLLYVPVLIFLIMTVIYYIGHAVKAIETIAAELNDRKEGRRTEQL